MVKLDASLVAKLTAKAFSREWRVGTVAAPSVVVDIGEMMVLLEFAATLVRIREHRDFMTALGTIECDRIMWMANMDDPEQETRPGESRDRVELQDLLWLLLKGEPFAEAPSEESAPRLRLVKDGE